MLVIWNETFTGIGQKVNLPDCNTIRNGIDWINGLSESDEPTGMETVGIVWNGLNQAVGIVQYNIGGPNGMERWNGTMEFHLSATAGKGMTPEFWYPVE